MLLNQCLISKFYIQQAFHTGRATGILITSGIKRCTQILVLHKFLHSGIPQYFDTNLQLQKWGNNTRHCQNEGNTSPYLDFSHLFTYQQSISLPVLPLMLQHCEINFLMRCMPPPQLGFSGESLRLVCSTRHIYHISY